MSSSVEPLFVPLTLFGALTVAGALVAGLRWLLSPSAGLPWPRRVRRRGRISRGG